MLDAHQLNVFLVAAETLNFTTTAKRLHMTQPSVSQHIQSLEKHFGTALFSRKGRHIELTDSGRTLVPLARDLVKTSIHIEETMDSLKGVVHGHLMVGCSTTPGKYVLPPLLARFHHLHPQVKVTCQVKSQEEAMQMLCDGEVHVALVSNADEVCKGVELRMFMTDPVDLIAPLGHPWAQRQEIELDELYEADFIMREESSGTYAAVREELAKHGVAVHDLKTLLTLGNSEAIALSVQEGLGVGFVSRMVITRLSLERVAQIAVHGLSVCRDIYIGRQTRHPASAAQNAFWGFVQKVQQDASEFDQVIALDA